MNENDTGDVRYGALQIGVVVGRNDPEQLGRVRVRIPGLCEPYSAWAWPLGTVGGGSKKRGFKAVPQVGAEVGVMFKGGDPDHPYYFAGHWGDGEIPTGGEDPDVHVLEFDRYSITVDERDKAAQSLVIRDKQSEDSIEFDGKAPGIVIKSTAALILESLGVISIEAATVVINGRKVSDGSSNI